MTNEEVARAANPDRPRVYDVEIDEFRFVTQSDVDVMYDRLSRAQMRLREIEKLVSEHFDIIRD